MLDKLKNYLPCDTRMWAAYLCEEAGLNAFRLNTVSGADFGGGLSG